MGQVKISPLLASVLTENLPDPTAISGEQFTILEIQCNQSK